MITDVIEMKAMSIEEAKKRAMKILDIQEDQILNINEKIKSKSFFGFFTKEGLYEIEYTEEEVDKKVEEIKVEKKKETPKSKIGVGRDLRKEREKKALAKEKINDGKIKSEVSKDEKVYETPKVSKEKVEEIIIKCKELLENMGLIIGVWNKRRSLNSISLRNLSYYI